MLDEAVAERVNELGTITWSGTTYRHSLASYDPLSGRGAYAHGGRWNPKNSFETLYLAQPESCCLAELARLAQAQGVDVTDLLAGRIARKLHTIEVHDVQVLDLRTEDALARVGLDATDIDGDDHSGCQTVGHAAYFLGFGGVLAPSATGSGLVLAAYEARLAPGQLEVISSEDLTPQRFSVGA